MWGKRLLVLASVVVVLLGVAAFLLFFGGKDFVRALWVINQIKNQEEKESVWQEFVGNDPRGPYGGILAGNAFNRIWIWGRGGLKGFPVDEYSVYSWFDGCSSEVLELLNSGQAGVIPRYLTTDMNDWRQKSEAGDYVRVFVTQPGTGGKEGNLREIYTYNFWLFLRAGMEERCAK